MKRVIDGDIIELESGEKVRLIGIDCAEVNNEKRNLENAELVEQAGLGPV